MPTTIETEYAAVVVFEARQRILSGDIEDVDGLFDQSLASLEETYTEYPFSANTLEEVGQLGTQELMNFLVQHEYIFEHQLPHRIRN